MFSAPVTATRLQIRTFATGDESAFIALWNTCGLLRPWNDPAQDIRRKLAVSAELFFVGEVDGQLIATLMAGYDGHRGWLNYLAVAPAFRRRGYARVLVVEAERRLTLEGCPKINLQIRTTNREVMAFYAALGYVTDDVVSMGRRLVQDRRPEAAPLAS